MKEKNSYKRSEGVHVRLYSDVGDHMQGLFKTLQPHPGLVWRSRPLIRHFILSRLGLQIGTTVEHSYNKPEIPGPIVCYKQEFVTSEQFPMRYCSTWVRSLLCYIKKFVIEEFVIRVFHCTLSTWQSSLRTYKSRAHESQYIRIYIYIYVLGWKRTQYSI